MLDKLEISIYMHLDKFKESIITTYLLRVCREYNSTKGYNPDFKKNNCQLFFD